ncbi:hypothetical protein BU16DRAFT_229897 [Lophium mytilinum]|uniref:Uncharacterized protein n=1 Tax=Lophium mytilinum TaxID=390894 RepID=A0A6A6Q7D1_9PEZI|nr:hypothetical protein BU16DRAFT_229897 [Lophium mytilinum]
MRIGGRDATISSCGWRSVGSKVTVTAATTYARETVKEATISSSSSNYILTHNSMPSHSATPFPHTHQSHHRGKSPSNHTRNLFQQCSAVSPCRITSPATTCPSPPSKAPIPAATSPTPLRNPS